MEENTMNLENNEVMDEVYTDDSYEESTEGLSDLAKGGIIAGGAALVAGAVIGVRKLVKNHKAKKAAKANGEEKPAEEKPKKEPGRVGKAIAAAKESWNSTKKKSTEEVKED